MGDSNFFSGFGDKSNEDLKQFENEKEKQVDEEINKSYDLERGLALLMEDDEDEDPKINIDNENSNLSSFSNFVKNNNLFNMSAINSEASNTNNKIIHENDDKGNYNISNISNNFPSFSQNLNVQNYENNIPNNLFNISKYYFG